MVIAEVRECVFLILRQSPNSGCSAMSEKRAFGSPRWNKSGRCQLHFWLVHTKPTAVIVQYSDKRGRLGCVIPCPGSLWPRGRVHATYYLPYNCHITFDLRNIINIIISISGNEGGGCEQARGQEGRLAEEAGGVHQRFAGRQGKKDSFRLQR